MNRVTVDLAGYPDLVVIYLGMRVNSPRGLKTALQFSPRISSSVNDRPDGLLLYENLLFSLFPLHVGMRQYWRDFEALEPVGLMRFAPQRPAQGAMFSARKRAGVAGDARLEPPIREDQ